MSDTTGSGYGSLILLLLPLLLLVYMMVSARKRAKVVQAMQSELTVGTEVLMTSGLYGRITALDDAKVTIDANGTSLVFDRRAVASSVSTEPGEGH
jgi:preprotein translocase subunit YajC